MIKKFTKLKPINKGRAIRLILLLFLLFTLSARLQPSYVVDVHLQDQDSASVYQYPSSPQQTPLQEQIQNPPPISYVYPLTRPQNLQPAIPFTVPHIITVYSRRQTASADTHDLFIYAAGIDMGTFHRNISIVGCLVGNAVYNPETTYFDIVKCTLPQSPSPDATISLLLLNNEVLQKALRLKTFHLKGLNFTLPPGVILDPPKNLNIKTDRFGEEVKIFGTKAVASNITWSTFPTEKIPKDEMLSRPRYHVCLLTMVKPFQESLEHWIRYHRSAGVDKVFIADNNANQSIAEQFEDWDDVEVVYWPFERSQMQGLSFLLHAMRARCEWVVTADVDEFVMPGIRGAGNIRPLSWFLHGRSKEGMMMSSFRYISMVGNRTTAATEPMPLAYTHLLIPEIVNGKAACRTNYDFVMHLVHTCGMDSSKMPKYEDELGPAEPTHVSSIPRTVHYKIRSWEEFKLKKQLGSSSVFDWNNKPEKDKFSGNVPQPQWFKEGTRKDREWTYFRDIYLEIMLKYGQESHTLVWENGNRWCEVEKNDFKETVGQVKCEDKEEHDGMA